MLVIGYVCRVYAPMVRQLAVVTAVAPTPSKALSSAMLGAQKIPLGKRRGMEFDLSETTYERGHGAHSEPPLELPCVLTFVHTLC